MRSKASVPQSRTDAGKKIETWTFDLPEGSRVPFDVVLHSKGANALQFEVRSDHPVFRDMRLFGTDLVKLHAALAEQVGERLEEHFGAAWRPSFLVEVNRRIQERVVTDHNTTDTDEINIRFTFQRVRENITAPRGNRGETRILQGAHPAEVIQRSHSDVFETDRSLAPDNFKFARERGEKTSRVVVEQTAATERALADMKAVLTAFAAGLADRFSPQEAGMRGLPTPTELLPILQAAIATASVSDKT